MNSSRTAAANIGWVGVAVPAHNEQELLPGCLAGIAAAAAVTPVPVDVLVVLDSCTDASTTAVGNAPTLTINERNVGAARRSGFQQLMRSRPSGLLERQCWLATTDAETIVPSDWLQRMLAHAARGWDATVGTVRVGDWDAHPQQTRGATWATTYDSRDGHRHVHGANLGFRGDAYAAAGGIPPIALSEDEQLIAALEAAGHRVLRTGDLAVVTSGRREGRVTGGFATFLLSLANGDTRSADPKDETAA